jgi:H+/Cl- antiporter ClcA
VTGASLRERLSGVRDPTEAAQILGRRRLAWYALCSVALSVTFGGYGVYLLVQVLGSRASGWTLLMLPGFVLVATFAGLFGYAIAYGTLTGRKWPRAVLVERFFEIVNNTDVLARRRRR